MTLPKPSSIADAVRLGAQSLAAISDSPRLDAELLMAHALRIERRNLPLADQSVPAPAAFNGLITRRAAQEPVAYIVGSCGFWTLDLKVTPDVLIPRPDSETLIEAAIEARTAAPPARILDMGTGSGALLLALLDHWKAARGVGIDASDKALAIARKNAARNGLAEQSRFHLADWRQAGWADSLAGAFDIVICNPPYVETDAQLAPQVREFEPGSALFAGPEGLDSYRAILPQLPMLLAPGGTAIFELGAGQCDSVSRLARLQGFACATRSDLGGHERALILSAQS